MKTDIEHLSLIYESLILKEALESTLNRLEFKLGVSLEDIKRHNIITGYHCTVTRNWDSRCNNLEDFHLGTLDQARHVVILNSLQSDYGIPFSEVKHILQDFTSISEDDEFEENYIYEVTIKYYSVYPEIIYEDPQDNYNPQYNEYDALVYRNMGEGEINEDNNYSILIHKNFEIIDVKLVEKYNVPFL